MRNILLLYPAILTQSWPNLFLRVALIGMLLLGFGSNLAGASSLVSTTPPSVQGSDAGFKNSQQVVLNLTDAPAMDRSEELRQWFLASGLSETDKTPVTLSGSKLNRMEIAGLFTRLEIAGFSVHLSDTPFSAFNSANIPAKGVLIDHNELREKFGRPGFEVLDVRTDNTWQFFERPPPFRSGHIPHSLPFGIGSLLPEKGFPDPAVARNEFAKLGPRPETTIDLAATFVIYGENGLDSRVSMTYLLLRAMGLRARIYARGWEEWHQVSGTPEVQILAQKELLAFVRKLKGPGPATEKDGFVLIDGREFRDYKVGHIPGAISMPGHNFELFLEPVVHYYWPNLDRATTPMILYCYDSQCLRSRNSATVAAHAGFQLLLILQGGMLEWRQSGFKICSPLLDQSANP